MFVGLRNCVTMSLASLIAYGIVGPWLVCRGANTPFHDDAFTSGCVSGYMATDDGSVSAHPAMCAARYSGCAFRF